MTTHNNSDGGRLPLPPGGFSIPLFFPEEPIRGPTTTSSQLEESDHIHRTTTTEKGLLTLLSEKGYAVPEILLKAEQEDIVAKEEEKVHKKEQQQRRQHQQTQPKYFWQYDHHGDDDAGVVVESMSQEESKNTASTPAHQPQQGKETSAEANLTIAEAPIAIPSSQEKKQQVSGGVGGSGSTGSFLFGRFQNNGGGFGGVRGGLRGIRSMLLDIERQRQEELIKEKLKELDIEAEEMEQFKELQTTYVVQARLHETKKNRKQEEEEMELPIPTTSRSASASSDDNDDDDYSAASSSSSSSSFEKDQAKKIISTTDKVENDKGEEEEEEEEGSSVSSSSSTSMSSSSSLVGDDDAEGPATDKREVDDDTNQAAADTVLKAPVHNKDDEEEEVEEAACTTTPTTRPVLDLALKSLDQSDEPLQIGRHGDEVSLGSIRLMTATATPKSPPNVGSRPTLRQRHHQWQSPPSWRKEHHVDVTFTNKLKNIRLQEEEDNDNNDDKDHLNFIIMGDGNEFSRNTTSEQLMETTKDNDLKNHHKNLDSLLFPFPKTASGRESSDGTIASNVTGFTQLWENTTTTTITGDDDDPSNAVRTVAKVPSIYQEKNVTTTNMMINPQDDEPHGDGHPHQYNRHSMSATERGESKSKKSKSHNETKRRKKRHEGKRNRSRSTSRAKKRSSEQGHMRRKSSSRSGISPPIKRDNDSPNTNSRESKQRTTTKRSHKEEHHHRHDIITTNVAEQKTSNAVVEKKDKNLSVTRRDFFDEDPFSVDRNASSNDGMTEMHQGVFHPHPTNMGPFLDNHTQFADTRPATTTTNIDLFDNNLFTNTSQYQSKNDKLSTPNGSLVMDPLPPAKRGSDLERLLEDFKAMQEDFDKEFQEFVEQLEMEKLHIGRGGGRSSRSKPKFWIRSTKKAAATATTTKADDDSDLDAKGFQPLSLQTLPHISDNEGEEDDNTDNNADNDLSKKNYMKNKEKKKRLKKVKKVWKKVKRVGQDVVQVQNPFLQQQHSGGGEHDHGHDHHNKDIQEEEDIENLELSAGLLRSFFQEGYNDEMK